MGKLEELHELIYKNLSLLRDAGHHIDFEVGMFKERNSPGFEAVGHALLMIIDPTECKNKIPWPLIKDKAQTREFRINFTKFIKMINVKYSEAAIPEITASTLQFPGGLGFLNFMYKLSTFALHLELKRTMSAEELKNHLCKPVSSKLAKDQIVKIKIVVGARRQEEKMLLQFKEYKSAAISVLQNLTDLNYKITKQIKSEMENLKVEVSSLKCDDKTKKSLLDIEDFIAITAYNEETEKKTKELESNCQELCHFRDLAVQCCHHGKLSMQVCNEAGCLDGYKLSNIGTLDKLTGGPLINIDGELKLMSILDAGLTAVKRLNQLSSSSPLLPSAQDLKVHCSRLEGRAGKLNSSSRRLLQENKQAIHELHSVASSKLKKKKMPDYFKFLKNHPPLTFLLPSTVSKMDVPVKSGKRRLSLNSLITLRKKKIICSFRTRREPRKHVSSTPLFKTPACRKSLYNSLPSGTRHKRIDEIKPFEITPDHPTLSPSVGSLNQESILSEPSPINNCMTDDAPAHAPAAQPSPAPRCSRKSLNDIVERFLKLKKNMSSNTNSKNESDTLDISDV